MYKFTNHEIKIAYAGVILGIIIGCLLTIFVITTYEDIVCLIGKINN